MILKVCQRPTGQGLVLPIGTTIRYHDNDIMKVCSVIGIDEKMEGTCNSAQIRALNSDKEYTAPNSSIIPSNEPDPSDILELPEATNKEVMTETIIKSKSNKPWETQDSYVNADDILLFHWHKWLSILRRNVLGDEPRDDIFIRYYIM